TAEALRSAETVRIATAKLDSVLYQAEELRAAKLAALQRAADLREVRAALSLWNKEWSKTHPEVRKARQECERNGQPGNHHRSQSSVTKLLAFLDWNYAHMRALESKLAMLSQFAEHDQQSLSLKVDNLVEDMRKVLMLPFSSLLEFFPKYVRELSQDQGKEVDLVLRGGEVEVDRRILEEIKDPLIHLVRNGIDHGIERPAEREQKKKPTRGTITMAISQKDGGQVEILLTDDGEGIDTAQVRAAALKLGALPPEEA